MTSQTTQIRACYGSMFAVIITLAAIAVAGSVWARSTTPQTGIDVSAMMLSIDTSRLPVETPDAF